MKNTYEETSFKNQILNLKSRFHQIANEAAFESFWQICIGKVAFFSNKDQLSKSFAEYNQKTYEVQEQLYHFQEFLQSVPLIVAIGNWVEGIINDEYTKERYLKGFTFLIENNLVPLTSNLKPMTLADMRVKGHQDILENIRCLPALTFHEKEELVQCYLRFSSDLAKYTLDYISTGYDPDRFLTASRLISYEAFYSFIQFLSVRDALIAKILYFGAPSIEEALSIKRDALDSKEFRIHFSSKSERFPKHLIGELIEFAQANANPKDLVFANLRGEQVERAHLNQSFSRASERMPKDVKITPGSLLRMSFDSGISNGKEFYI